MVAQHIQANYDCLQEMMKLFMRHADMTVALTFQIEALIDQLQGGAWRGVGAEAFYAEMRDLILPAMGKLQDALQFAGEGTGKIHHILREAEEEAARLFRGETNLFSDDGLLWQAAYNRNMNSGGYPFAPNQQNTSSCTTTLIGYGINPIDANTICSSTSSFPLTPFPFLKTDAAGTSSNYGTLNHNRQAGIDYALRWMYAKKGSTNREWPTFGDGDDNCTNFISQIMFMGGFDPRGEGWGINSTYPDIFATESAPADGCYAGEVISPLKDSLCYPAWSITPRLRDYLMMTKQFSVTSVNFYSPSQVPPITQTSAPNIKPGDVVFFHSTGQPIQPNHAGIVIGWGPPVGANGKLDMQADLVPWIADQSGNGHPRPINDLNAPVDKIEIVHMKYPGE